MPLASVAVKVTVVVPTGNCTSSKEPLPDEGVAPVAVQVTVTPGQLSVAEGAATSIATLLCPTGAVAVWLPTAAMVGAFPLAAGSRDAALLVNLYSGAYTVEIAPQTGSGGQVLAEVYEVP